MIASSREKILITVKTYPTPSKKYIELVCTAGVREDGSWVRIYPIQYGRLENYYKFKKYHWIEIDLLKRGHRDSDKRPESFSPSNIHTMSIVGEIGTDNKWEERKEIILNRTQVYDNLTDLISLAHSNQLSLATFKPEEIFDFKIEPANNISLHNNLKDLLKQINLFPEDGLKTDFLLSKQLPYKFSYCFTDKHGKKSKLMIADWEIGQLFWHCYRDYKDEHMACEKVKEKYFDNFIMTKDIFFFLGTTLEFHMRSPNPFIIIGVFYPPKDLQIHMEFG